MFVCFLFYLFYFILLQPSTSFPGHFGKPRSCRLDDFDDLGRIAFERMSQMYSTVFMTSLHFAYNDPVPTRNGDFAFISVCTLEERKMCFCIIDI